MACLSSLAGLDYPKHDVIVVDNGSPAGGPATIAAAFPEATLIRNPANLGFAGGCNVGISHALDRGADYVLLVNDDATVAADMLTKLVGAAESDRRIGVVAPRICYANDPDLIWSDGGSVDSLGLPSHLGLDEKASRRAAGLRDVEYVSGCVLLASRRLIRSIGDLDARFFAYFEETEWCARARQAGFRVVAATDALAWHDVRKETTLPSWSYTYLMTRNRLLFLSCIGAGRSVRFRALASLARTAAGLLLRSRDSDRRRLAGAIARGSLDYGLSRFGAPPEPA
jgi:hypothetical protein